MKKARVFLAMLTNALALGLILLILLDLRNPYMQFLSSVPSRLFMLALSLCALALATLTLADSRRR